MGKETNMFEKLKGNFRKPQGKIGAFMVNMMNRGHEPMTKKSIERLPIEKNHAVLDIGCGGGNAVALMLEKVTQGKVYGVDYSEVSVAQTKQKNKAAINEGRACVQQASVSKLPFEDEQFDVVTAFETIYFWPNLAQDFREVHRVIKSGGWFAVICELADPTSKEGKRFGKSLGMAIQTPETLKKLFAEAGYVDMMVLNEPGEEWVCLAGRKEE
jgi:Methylase involved in ubiquinone/menaquinone biosynthesis